MIGRFRLRSIAAFILFALAATFVGCDQDDSGDVPEGLKQSSIEEIEEEILGVLSGRSFRQFDPSVDASTRKGVILDFHDGIKVWAQYAAGNRAINEWELIATDYSVEWNDRFSEITITLNKTKMVQGLPTKCDDCIQVTGFSILIRDLFNDEKLSFKLNGPRDVLPPPFPIFTSWTRFNEDEYVD